MLESVKVLVEDNPVWFLIFFALSVVANLLQVLSYFSDRKHSQLEARQRDEDRQRLATYEFLFDRADKQVMTQAELKALQEEIDKHSLRIPELTRRIELLQQAAKREVIAQNIERNITIISDAYEELLTMRADHKALGVLPDLPESTRLQIEAEVRATAKRPFEFPKSLTFRCLLLVLFIMLLPWPVDTVLTVAFLHVFLIAFFEAANLSREAEITGWIVRHRNKIGLASAIGSWYMLCQAANSLLAHPLNTGIDIVIQTIRESLDFRHGLIRSLLIHGYVVGELLMLLIAVLAGLLHWRAIAGPVLESVPEHHETGKPMGGNVNVPPSPAVP